MKSYRATGVKSFDIAELGYKDPALIKLKIDLISPSVADVAIFQGKLNIEYPITPCSMATAIVSEDRPEYGLKRGTKVILNPYVQGSNNLYTEPKTFGVDRDGFLANFIEISIDNIVPFPDDVKAEEAVFTNMLAVAISSLSGVRFEKGTYISIIGGSLLNIIIAQLALYYQAIPIFISTDARYLKIAENVGIYYCLDETKEDVARRVFEITGGRMSEYSIIHALPWVTPGFLSSLTSRGGECRVVSLNSAYLPRLEANLSDYTKKNLTLKGVSCGFSEFNSAINLLALKQISFDGFTDKRVSLEDSLNLFKEMSNNPSIYVGPIIQA